MIKGPPPSLAGTAQAALILLIIPTIEGIKLRARKRINGRCSLRGTLRVESERARPRSAGNGCGWLCYRKGERVMVDQL